MQTGVNHIIRKISMQVHTPGIENAFDFQQKLGGYIKNELSQKLENLFNKYNSEEFIFIDKLVIDCRLAKLESAAELFLAVESIMEEQLKKAMERQTGKAGKKRDELIKYQLLHNDFQWPDYEEDLNTGKQLSKSNLLTGFIWFLEKGYFPWWLQSTDATRIKGMMIEAIMNNVDMFFKVTADKITLQPSSARRLVNYFTKEEEKKIFLAIHNQLEKLQNLPGYILALIDGADDAKAKSGDKQSIQLTSLQQREWVWKKILRFDIQELRQIASDSASGQTSKKQFYKEIFGENNLKPDDPHRLKISLIEEKKYHEQTIAQKQTEKNILPQKKDFLFTNQDGIYISNAGLVLVHPFLRHLFTHLQLLDENGKISDTNLSKAVQLVWLLGYGEMEFAEQDTVLPKLLCGLEPSYELNYLLPAEENEKQECNNLLQSMIDHWGVLKSTSPDGLRSGFFNRDGKLIYKDDCWLLQVETKAMDILLEKLPWGISIIKLPWMKTMLKTEWIF